MKTRFNEAYENDDTPSRESVEKYRDVIRDDEHEANLALVSYRSGKNEFLHGLAKRGDPNIVIELINEWRDDFVSELSIEAAEEVSDPRLLHRLKHFEDIYDFSDDKWFGQHLADAITACTTEKEIKDP